MNSIAFQRDVGAFIVGKNALNPQTITTTGDGSEKTGYSIDRNDDTSDPFLSAKVIIPYSASLAAGNTLTLKSNAQDSSSTASGWADYDDKDGSTANTATIGSTGSTAAQTLSGVLEYDLDLSSAKRYLRVQVTPTLSGSSTESDDVDLGGVMVLGGANVLPAS